MMGQHDRSDALLQKFKFGRAFGKRWKRAWEGHGFSHTTEPVTRTALAAAALPSSTLIFPPRTYSACFVETFTLFSVPQCLRGGCRAYNRD
jgi:hypothetical protein